MLNNPRQIFNLNVILSLIGLMGVFFTTIGYGICLGISDALHIGYGQVMTSAFDAISLSWIGFFYLHFENLPKFDIDFVVGQLKNDPLIVPTIFLIFVTIYIIKFIYAKRSHHKQNKVSIPSLIKIPDDNKFVEEKLPKHALRLMLYLGFLYIGKVCIFIISMAIILLFILIPFAVTYIGINAGANYVQEFIIKPEMCTPLQNREQRSATILKDTRQYVNCSRVSSYDGKLIAQGREVIINSEFILLYQPKTGKVLRINLKDQPITVTSVDIL